MSLNRLKQPRSTDELLKLFEKHDVPTDSWVASPDKAGSLIKEVSKHEVNLELSVTNKLEIHRNLVCIDVTFRLADREFLLSEDQAHLGDLSFSEQTTQSSISGACRLLEQDQPKRAAYRVTEELLGISASLHRFRKGRKLSLAGGQDTDRYPGLRISTHRNFFVLELLPVEYREDGLYPEKQYQWRLLHQGVKRGQIRERTHSFA